MFKQVWNLYEPFERRNIGVYILGIMFYKLGLEIFNGSILSMASDRFTLHHTFTKLGAASGANQAAQCIGSILIAPLIMKWPTRIVLSTAIFFFALMTTLLLIIDAATGGSMKDSKHDAPHYGRWNDNLIFLIWTLSGVAYGMVELIRRIIPAEIVGGEVGKLRRMDATVHVFYEIMGTIGAGAGSAAISRLGNNFSFFLTPVFFTVAAGIWFFLGDLGFQERQRALASVEKPPSSDGYLVMIYRGFLAFIQSIVYGTSLVLGRLHFLWLLPSYSLAFYLHRFLENSLGTAFAKRVLGQSSWSQIITGGSNLGELFGALFVFLLSDYVTTPLPWLRLDAILLNIVWILPRFSEIATQHVIWAWKLAGCFLPVSLGWAAGDVSLSAYIQSHLTQSEAANSKGISALGSIMAFLYVAFIVLEAVLSPLLGKIIDNDANEPGDPDITEALRRVAGIQYSVCCGIILLATLIPVGSWALNPKHIGRYKEIDESPEDAPRRRHAVTDA